MILQRNDEINYACELCSRLYHSADTEDGHLDDRFVKNMYVQYWKGLKTKIIDLIPYSWHDEITKRKHINESPTDASRWGFLILFA